MTDIASILSKKYNEGYLGNTAPTLQRVSTGYMGLDYILGGGLPLGRMVEISASGSGGKTTTSLCISRNLVNMNESVAYIDLERSCDKQRLEQLGLYNNKAFHYFRPNDGETALNIAVDCAELGVKLVVIDSVPNLLPKTSMQADVGKAMYSPVARLLSAEQPKLVEVFERSQCCLWMINQVRDSVGSFSGGKTTPGGNALKHMLSIRISLYRSSEAKDNSSFTMNYKTTKNKTAVEKLSTEIIYYKDDRLLCPYSSLLIEGIKADVIKQAGAYYKISKELATSLKISDTIGQGRERALELLKTNNELHDNLYQQVLKKYDFN